MKKKTQVNVSIHFTEPRIYMLRKLYDKTTTIHNVSSESVFKELLLNAICSRSLRKAVTWHTVGLCNLMYILGSRNLNEKWGAPFAIKQLNRAQNVIL